MNPHAGHTLWLLAVAGIVLIGCTNAKTVSNDAKTVSNDAKTIEKSGPALEPKVGGDLKIPRLSPAVAAKWREHTLDLSFVVGYEEGMKLAAQSNRPAMMFVTATW